MKHILSLLERQRLCVHIHQWWMSHLGTALSKMGWAIAMQHIPLSLGTRLLCPWFLNRAHFFVLALLVPPCMYV